MLPDVLSGMDLGGKAEPPKADPEPTSDRDIAAAMREAVENAMPALRDAVVDGVRTAMEPAEPHQEPEPAPVSPRRSRWRDALWGES